MKLLLIFILIGSLFTETNAQKKESKYLGIAALTTQTAVPFGKFSGLLTDQFHPGVEATYGGNLSSRKKHDWSLELRLGYFFHRYVQHGIPLYLNFGYRYKLTKIISAETSLGAGYMHSIPATEKLTLNENGHYVNDKGVGRMQAVATYSLGLGCTPQPSVKKPLTIFMSYQQRVQMPFVKSYVPFLSYNSLMIGIRKVIR